MINANKPLLNKEMLLRINYSLSKNNSENKGRPIFDAVSVINSSVEVEKIKKSCRDLSEKLANPNISEKQRRIMDRDLCALKSCLKAIGVI